MHFENLQIQNILPYVGAELNLANRGLVLIQGEIEGSAALSSNGAGKSSLIDCILLALFGRTLFGKRGNSVTHFGRGDGLLSLAGMTEAGRTFILDRPFNHSQVPRVRMEFGDAPAVIGEDAVKQILRSEIIGPISFSTFVASSVFTETGLFSSLDDAGKKQIFEELLILEEISGALVRVKIANAALTEQRRKMEKAQLVEDGETNVLQGFLTREAERVEQFEARRKALVIDSSKKRQTLELQAKEATEKLHERVQQEAEAIEGERKAVEELAKAQRGLDEAASIHLAAAEEVSRIAADLANAKKAANKAEKLTSECPECEQTVPPFMKASLVKRYNVEVVGGEKDLTRVKKAAKDAEATVKELKANMKHAEERLAFVRSRIIGIRHDQRKFEQARSDAHAAIENLAMETIQVGAADALAEMKKSLDKATSDLHALRTAKLRRQIEMEEIDDQLLRHSFWVQGYGPQGMKNWLIEDALPYVNQQAKMYSEILAEGELLAQISATKTTQAGEVREKMQVLVTTPFQTQDYWDCSSGMRCRADVAITLAIGDYASSRCTYPIRLALLDELFDPLDEVGVEKAMGLLKGLTKDRESIFVISHSPFVQQHFTSKEIVRFGPDGVARLTQNC